MSNARTLASTINSSSEIVVPSGGIQFTDATNANTVSSQSNLIEQDGYEEGSWNPTFSFTGGSTGVAPSSFVGRYSKIGDVVFLWGNINLTNKGSDTGSVIIGGFPFTIISVSMKFTGPIGAGRVNTSQSTYYIIEGIHSSTTADLMAYYTNTSGNKFNVTNSHVSNTSFLHFQLTYKTV